MAPDVILRQRLHARLRRDPRAFSVPSSTPVLFFGDLFTARVATVGLNPSDQEFLDRRGDQLTGAARRFETLDSLDAPDRRTLGNEQCEQAVETMRRYFHPGKPVYGWFKALSRVTEGLGASFIGGEAAHLDLVQEATHPTWSALPDDERAALLHADLPFLEWQIQTFPAEVVVCTGKTVSNHVRSRLRVQVEEEGELARIKWWLGHAELERGRVFFCGWNLPLARPTGLGAAGETQLGELFAERLAALA